MLDSRHCSCIRTRLYFLYSIHAIDDYELKDYKAKCARLSEIFFSRLRKVKEGENVTCCLPCYMLFRGMECYSSLEADFMDSTKLGKFK